MTSKTRIALITTELSVGGAERCVTNLACGLDSKEFEPFVISLMSPPSPPKDGLVQQLESSRIAIKFLNCNSKFQLVSAVRNLRTELKTIGCDLVASYLFHANVISAAATSGLRCKTIQALRVIEQGWHRRQLQKLAARQADRVLCVSQGVAHFAENSLAIPADKVQVIPNGYPIDQLPERLPDAESKRILAIGRLVPQKNYQRLIEWAAELLPDFPEWRISIVGDGPDRTMIENLIAGHNLDQQVFLLDWQANTRQLLQESEIYVLTSDWEGMPNSLIEAMACRLPVVASNVEGVPDLLHGELKQQIIPRDEPQRATAFLRHLMSDKQLRQQLGEKNRNRISDQFSLSQMIAAYSAAFRQLTATR